MAIKWKLKDEHQREDLPSSIYQGRTIQCILNTKPKKQPRIGKRPRFLPRLEIMRLPQVFQRRAPRRNQRRRRKRLIKIDKPFWPLLSFDNSSTLRRRRHRSSLPRSSFPPRLLQHLDTSPPSHLFPLRRLPGHLSEPMCRRRDLAVSHKRRRRLLDLARFLALGRGAFPVRVGCVHALGELGRVVGRVFGGGHFQLLASLAEEDVEDD